jgi:hypothetical protein
MKFEDSEKKLKLSQSFKSEQLHHKIIDELNRVNDTRDNIKLQNICSHDLCQKGFLHEPGVVYEFCIKEGCRLLHLMDCIGKIGLKTIILNITNKQLHLKITDEFKKLGDAFDHNVKLRTMRNNGPCQKAGALHEAGVVYKFCFKEGCRLLHYLNYIGGIGLTTATLSTINKQLHLKIIDEFNMLGDTLDKNVKPRTIRNNGPCQKAQVIQEASVVHKFCFKEGCRLLHHLDCIGVFGLTTTTLRPSHLSSSTWRAEKPPETNSLDCRSHRAGETHQHHHAEVHSINRPTIAGTVLILNWTPAIDF